MAEAKLLEAKKPDVELILSYDEAEFLFRLVGAHVVGGGSNRALSQSIYGGLNSLSAHFRVDAFNGGVIDVTE